MRFAVYTIDVRIWLESPLPILSAICSIENLPYYPLEMIGGQNSGCARQLTVLNWANDGSIGIQVGGLWVAIEAYGESLVDFDLDHWKCLGFLKRYVIYCKLEEWSANLYLTRTQDHNAVYDDSLTNVSLGGLLQNAWAGVLRANTPMTFFCTKFLNHADLPSVILSLSHAYYRREAFCTYQYRYSNHRAPYYQAMKTATAAGPSSLDNLDNPEDPDKPKDRTRVNILIVEAENPEVAMVDFVSPHPRGRRSVECPIFSTPPVSFAPDNARSPMSNGNRSRSYSGSSVSLIRTTTECQKITSPMEIVQHKKVGRSWRYLEGWQERKEYLNE
ncbi:uncharacterized protein BDR25DRAFT_361425 [Lindgomyces ingoldianus]|uniref:Uncharacterized protein n=1 Tax=Lindgomyces ingoldianus TaxID=673940 RepID=A0ACB6QC85_9PLEO|nr:uncharacterized protein BDR25DRAFT_361425 [Lindgomyces ingoldianus]KAF2464584.1 hypothetical protein BDR25DRAFT_361425 [Lindgomyces ingoldianus]